MQAKGIGGTVDVDDERVVLAWNGLGRRSRGVKGPRVIPGWAIEGVDLVEPHRATPGQLRVRLVGDAADRPAPSSDPSVLEFGIRQLAAMEHAAEAARDLCRRHAGERRADVSLAGPAVVVPEPLPVQQHQAAAPAFAMPSDPLDSWWAKLCMHLAVGSALFALVAMVAAVVLFAIGFWILFA